MVKGLRKSIKQSTHTRVDKKLGRIFVHLSGPKLVESQSREETVINAWRLVTV